MTISPAELSDEVTLVTAATRIDFLSRRDTVSAEPATTPDPEPDDDLSAFRDTGTSLDRYEALELLALGEVVYRKAHDSRHLGIHAALRNGAGWADIATALDGDAGEAWDAHQAWITQQVALHAKDPAEGLESDVVEVARELAGARPA